MSKSLPKTRRKEALQQRANAYGDREVESGEWPIRRVGLATAYEDGYRAAMRDARAAWNSEDSRVMAEIALLDFLKPLK